VKRVGTRFVTVLNQTDVALLTECELRHACGAYRLRRRYTRGRPIVTVIPPTGSLVVCRVFTGEARVVAVEKNVNGKKVLICCLVLLPWPEAMAGLLGLLWAWWHIHS
jgi:hypothetical protein